MADLTVVDNFNEFMADFEPLGIVVKSFTQVGSLASPSFGTASFTAWEIVSLDDQRALYAISIEIERPNQHPTAGSVSIPYDEVDRIVAGLGMLEKGGRRGLKRMTNFEANISGADGNFRACVFNSANGRIMASIEAAGVSLFFHDCAKLSEVVKYLSVAKQYIEKIKIS